MDIFIKTFSDLNKTNVAIVGGKGASLGEMTNAGILVPPGFVVLSAAFEKFLEETDLNVEIDSILEKVKHEDINTVEQASEKIQALVLTAKMPDDIASLIQKYFNELGTEYVAVRSSATAEDSASAAWAGQLDSFLNTTETDLLDKVKRCWASLFTPRAIFYRFEQNLHTQKISVAVVIQKMVVSEVSGIAFSVHPVTQDYNQLIIEAGFGLGEAIVSGQITPDSYVVEKVPRRIIDKNVAEQTRGIFRTNGRGPTSPGASERQANEWQEIPSIRGHQQKISNEQILELSEIILGIENHYGFPCDIEWAFEGGIFYIVQSRPITTLVKKETEIKKETFDENWTKVWTTEYSLFSVWMFGRSFADICWQEVGVGFSKIIFLVEGPLATVFRLDEEQKEFAKKMASRFLFEEKFLDKTVKLMFDIQAEFEEFFEMPEQIVLTPEKWSRFLEIHRLYQPNFLGVLWAPNELENFNTQANLYEKIFAVCESARKKSESVFPSLEKFLQKLFRFIATKEGINENFLRAILPGELVAYINGQGLPDEKILKSRYDYSAVLATKDKNELLLNTEARQLIGRISKINIEGINEIRGTVANQGVVKGKVRLVFMEQDLNKVQVGDVIVTTMTRPEWVPVMKIAGAYVTDAGSVLCHAAIVSREFNKPCIISTKIATQVLHDGDLVEVDADNGVVRILSNTIKLPPKEDWEFVFQRNNHPPLFVSLFYFVESKMMEGLIGGGFHKQLAVRQEDETYYFYSTKDMMRMRHNIQQFLAEQNDQLATLFSRAATISETNTDFLKQIKQFDVPTILKRVDEIVKTCTEILFYSSSMPYFILDAIDTLPPMTQTKFKSIQRKCETLRAVSLNEDLMLVLSKIAKAVVQTFSVSIENAFSLTIPEVSVLQKNGQLPIDIQELAKRKKCTYWDSGDSTILFSYDQQIGDDLLKVAIPVFATDKSIAITGTTAFSGVVRGTVCIINADSDMQKVHEGDILVSPMTNPALLPAFKRAGAVVTNEGGLACHAAILARELKKPCIIGTKIATKVLHDGDLVEVDADNGIVKIIN